MVLSSTKPIAKRVCGIMKCTVSGALGPRVIVVQLQRVKHNRYRKFLVIIVTVASGVFSIAM